MLTKEEQDTILSKVELMRRNYHQCRMRVLKGEVSPKSSQEIAERDLRELHEILKEAG